MAAEKVETPGAKKISVEKQKNKKMLMNDRAMALMVDYREKQDKQKKEQKLHAKKNIMKVDGSNKKKSGSGFQVGKRKVKVKMTALAKAKAAQAMELDN
ncbi:unnamed protein product [Sphenostylis stenocarpa]|uniref:Uncharacterized protein n=1 Tax=Sphenostylis stenocarpa TaxID=92480 RepID=A0AA86SB78_9FABA|nr:unnamed protein product [Sphenostylis stenocarpa]